MTRTIKLLLREENDKYTIVLRSTGQPTHRHHYNTRAEAEAALRRALDVGIGLHFQGICTEINIEGSIVLEPKAA